MFLSELTPLLREGLEQPMAFLGGLCVGLLRVDLNQDPVKSWLNQQMGQPTSSPDVPASQNGKSDGPKSITID